MTKTKFFLAAICCLMLHFALHAQQPNLQSLSNTSKMLAWGWQGESMVSYNSDGYCRWWTNDGVCQDSFACDFTKLPKPCALFTKNSYFLLLQNTDSTFCVWDVPARMKIWENSVGGKGITALAISPNNKFMSATYSTGVVLFDSTGLVVARFAHEKTPVSLAVSDFGMTMVAYQEGEKGSIVTKTWGPEVYKSFTQVTSDTPENIEKQVKIPLSIKESAQEKKAENESIKTSEYAVCVGTFSTEANAVKRLEDAKDWGFATARLVKKGDKYSIYANFFPKYELAWKVKKQLEEQYNIHAAVIRVN
jgi:hypothetical protein